MEARSPERAAGRWELSWPIRRVGARPTPDALRLPSRSDPAILLGRDTDCDVVLPDTAVSRHHAALILYAGRWFVLDRRSTNGTWVNGRRIWGASSVKPGDVLRLGHTAFRLAA